MNVTQLTKVSSFDAELKFKEYTKKALFKCIGQEKNPLDLWIQIVEDETRTTKQKGDLFEILCKKYLLHYRPVTFKKVWLLGELPIEIRNELNLRKQDLGIDLIGLDSGGHYHAVQAKFRGRRNVGYSKYKPMVGWKEVSTFDTLARRTGPYKMHWIITTGDRIKRIGRKQPKDKSICYRSLLRLAKGDFWRGLVNLKGQKLNDGGGRVKMTKAETRVFVMNMRSKWTKIDLLL